MSVPAHFGVLGFSCMAAAAALSALSQCSAPPAAGIDRGAPAQGLQDAAAPDPALSEHVAVFARDAGEGVFIEVQPQAPVPVFDVARSTDAEDREPDWQQAMPGFFSVPDPSVHYHCIEGMALPHPSEHPLAVPFEFNGMVYCFMPLMLVHE